MPEVNQMAGDDGKFLDYIFKLSDGASFDAVRLLFGGWVNVLLVGHQAVVQPYSPTYYLI